MHLIFQRFLLPKWTKNDPEMRGNKIRKISLWAPWAAKGASEDPQSHPLGAQSSKNGAQGTPRASKIDSKTPPERPKRCPSEPRAPKMGPKLPPRIQNGAQVSKLFKRSAHEQTNTHTQTRTDRRKRLLNNPTTHQTKQQPS